MNLNLPKESRTFTGGMIKDVIASKIPKNQYVEALNMQITAPEVEKLGGSKVSIGNEQVIDLSTGYDPERKAYRITLNNSSASIAHDFDWNGVAGTTVISANVTPSLRYADLVSQVIASAAGQGITITVTTVSPIAGTAAVIHLGISSDTDFTVAEEITSVNTPVYIIHEFYTTGFGIAFNLLKSFNIGEDLYLISSNGEVFRLGVAKKNATTGVWTYTILFETATITIDTEAVVDFEGEIDNGTRVSLYLIGKGVWPRALYVVHENVWETQYSFVYTEAAQYIESGNPNGFYTHENVEEKSRLQVLENYARINGPDLLSVNNTGGGIPTGGYYYLFRQMVGNETTTNFSLVSNLVPIFEDSLTDTELSGSNGGLATSKSVDLPITGLDPTIYDKFEIGVLVNTNGVFSAYTIGPYKINSTTQTVIHTGFETQFSLALSELVIQQILIREGKNLVINRNRLFASNVTVQLDYDLADYCRSTSGNITLTTVRDAIPACSSVSTPVIAEYQVPENVFERTAYMLNETYRIGILFYFNTGFVSVPYFVEDFKITFATGELTEMSGSMPVNIYIYHPQGTVDLSAFPDIEGVPFSQAVKAYSFVRLPCIPEIQQTGYALTHTGSSNGFYSVGRYLAEGAEYTRDASDPDRTRLGFISPDILFNESDPVFSPSHKLFNYGQPFRYATHTQSPTAFDFRNNFEFAGDFGAYTELNISKSQFVPFNSEGTTEINGGLKYRTTVDLPAGQGGNNQKSVGIGLASTYFANPLNLNIDYGLYYQQHFVEKTDKYGTETTGNYISVGHFRTINGNGPYTDDIYGGDTFTQKNFIKCVNYDKEIFVPTTEEVFAGFFFPHGSYLYTIVGLLPDGITFVSGAGAALVVKTGLNDMIAVTVSWNTYEGMNWNLYRTDPGGLSYLMYTGTMPTFTDDNSGGALTGLPTVIPTEIDVRAGISVYTQNRANTQLRYFTDTETDLNLPYQTLSETVWLSDKFDEGTLLYSESYTPSNSLQTMLVFDPDAPRNDKYTNIVQYSGFKIGESVSDPYRSFKPFDRKSYPAIYGEINNTFRYKNFLVILMDTAVLLQELDQQVTVSTASGQPIQVGDGSVMGAREDPISYYGNQIKTAACMYLHEGQIYIGWYDKYHNKIIRRGIDGVKDLGETNYIQSFLNANNQYVGDEWSMVMGYDDLTKEFLVSTNATIPDSTQWDDVATFLTDDIAYTGIDSQSTQYWKARRAVPADIDPRDPANQLQYWEPYYNSNYTLAFNEKENQWSGLYSYKTRQFVPYKNTFLTWYFSNSGDNPLSELFEHNRGGILNWYGIDFLAYLKVKFNDVPDLFKESRVLWLRSDNQPYYLHVRGNVKGKTYGIQDDFKQLRDFWSISPKNDATYDMPVLPRGTNTTGINTLCTGPVRGETIEVTVFFDDENFVSEMIHTYQPKRKYP